LWAFLYGELGLAPAVARGLDWVEVYHYQQGHARRQQRELAGHRLVATLLRNSMSEEAITPHEFLPLPLVDGPDPDGSGITAASTAALLARMKERFGEPAADLPPTP